MRGQWSLTMGITSMLPRFYSWTLVCVFWSTSYSLCILHVRFQGLFGEYHKAQSLIQDLSKQNEELQAKLATTETDGDGGGSGGGGGGAEALSSTIAALRDELEEVSQARDDAEKRAAGAAGGGVQNAAGDGGVATRAAAEAEELKTQVAQSKADNAELISRLEEMAEKYRTLLAQEQCSEDAVNDATASRSADYDRLREAERELTTANQRAAALDTRCLKAEAELESTTSSLHDARRRLAEFESSVGGAAGDTTAAATNARESQSPVDLTYLHRYMRVCGSVHVQLMGCIYFGPRRCSPWLGDG